MGNRYWFKPKTYGYGFMPITWEGWLATLGVIVLIFCSAWIHQIAMDHPQPRDIAGFLLDIVLISIGATLLFDKKMEEKLKWRWGK